MTSHTPASEQRDLAAAVRARPDNPYALRGFGPLVVGIVLILLIVLLLPSVAREHNIPVQPAATTTTDVAP